MFRKLASLFILLLLWFGVSYNLSLNFFPSPIDVLHILVNPKIFYTIVTNVFISLGRVVTALICAFTPAMVLSILTSRSTKLSQLFNPIIYMLFPVPKIALLPIILLFLGLGNLSKIFLVALIVFFQFYITISDGIRHIDKKYFESFSSLGGSTVQSIIHIILPASLPRVFSTLRLTMGTSIAVLFMTETYASRSGIGWYIMDAWSRFSYIEMYAGIVFLGLTGFLLVELINVGEYFCCPWLRNNNSSA
ncbi:ABC transporter permease [Spirochaeta cellobiosiphila]|uniref:ABC transporter permease n=1 Tax=Spirochaeta cellobiosiphila TaxID=504483 RepID=UPI0003FF18BB|nr:ABC transporter permease [Spirochaeta cellobiosiphila]